MDDPARGAWAKANFDRVDARIRELELENMARSFPVPDAEKVAEAILAVSDLPEVTGVPVSAPSPSASPFSLYQDYHNSQMVTSVLGYRVPEKTEREQEEDVYFDIAGDPPAGKPTTYKDWRAEYLRTGMSLPFERMMERVTQHTRTKALDGVDDYDPPVKPRKQKYWHDIDGRPHPKPARKKPSASLVTAVIALLWIGLILGLFL
jgi:hypothetical protein